MCQTSIFLHYVPYHLQFTPLIWPRSLITLRDSGPYSTFTFLCDSVVLQWEALCLHCCSLMAAAPFLSTVILRSAGIWKKKWMDVLYWFSPQKQPPNRPKHTKKLWQDVVHHCKIVEHGKQHFYWGTSHSAHTPPIHTFETFSTSCSSTANSAWIIQFFLNCL